MVAAFFIGGAIYIIIELLWRGRTHPSMFFAGGASLCALLLISKSGMHLMLQCIAGAAAITVIELLFGLVLNVVLRLNVWDYSTRRLNFKGQICLLYSVLWLPLSFAGLMLCRFI